MRILFIAKIFLLLGTLTVLAGAPRTSIEPGPHFVGDSVTLSIVIPGTREPHQVDLSPLSHLEARILEAAPLPSTAEAAFLIRIRILASQTGTFSIPSLRVWGPEGIWQTDPGDFTVQLPAVSDEIRIQQQSHKQQVYVGEAFVVEVVWEFDAAITAIHAVDLRLPWLSDQRLRVFKPRTLPPLPGNDIGLPVSSTRVIAKVEGRTIRFHKILVAREPGTLTLAPATVLASRSLQTRPGRGGSFQYPAYFDNQFFNAPPAGDFSRIFASSDPLVIEVLPLPAESKPATFTGIVSAFDLSASVNPDRGYVGSPLQLELRVENHEFPETLDLPALADLPGFTGRFNLPPDRGIPGLSFDGSNWVRTFHQSIRPLSTGVEFVPAITISYFNPKSGIYETTTSERLPLRIDAARMASIFEATLDDGSRLHNRLQANEHGLAALFSSDALQSLANGKRPLSSLRFWSLAIGLPILFSLIALSATHRLRLTLHKPSLARAYYAFDDFRRELHRNRGHVERLNALKAYFASRLGSPVVALTPGSILQGLQRHNLDPQSFALSLEVLRDDDQSIYGPAATSTERIDWSAIENELRLAGRIVPQFPGKGFAGQFIGPRWLPLWSSLAVILLLLAYSGQPAFEAGSLPDEAISEAERFFISGLERQLDEPLESEADFVRSAALYELALEYSQHPVQRARLHYNAASARFFSGEKGRALQHLLLARKLAPEDPVTRRAISHIRDERIDRVTLPWYERMLSSPVSLTKQFSQTVQRFSLGLLISVLCLLVVVHEFFPRRALRRLAIPGVAVLLLLFAALLLREQQLLQLSGRGVVVAGETIAREGNGLLYPPALQSPLHDGFEFSWIERRGDWVAIKPGGDLPIVWVQAEHLLLH